MRTTNECYVYFSLWGETLEPDAISRQLGLLPYDVGNVGDKLRNERVRKEGHWALHDRIECDARVDYETRVKDVLDQLGPCFDAAIALAREFNGTIVLVGYFIEYDPGLWFEAETIQRIAALGASVQCDFYNLIEREPAEPPTPRPSSPRRPS